MLNQTGKSMLALAAVIAASLDSIDRTCAAETKPAKRGRRKGSPTPILYCHVAEGVNLPGRNSRECRYGAVSRSDHSLSLMPPRIFHPFPFRIQV